MSAASSAGPTTDVRPVRRALISVYDKSGLEELVRGLHDHGVALVSTGGSAKFIADLGIPVTEVADLTGFPECLDGRCLLYTSPSPRDRTRSRMPSSA